MKLKDAQTSAVGSQPAPVHQYPWEDPLLCGETVRPAEPGYKRSLALIHQIGVINANEGVDYCLFSCSKDLFAVVLPIGIPKMIFRQFRDEAMSSGDREAAAALGQFLVRHQHTYSKAEVFKQLSNEYGFDMGHAVAQLDEWSTREARGLSKIQVESQNCMDHGRALLRDPGLAEERNKWLGEMVDMLRGKMSAK